MWEGPFWAWFETIMLNVTVVLFGDGFASTSIAPLEIFFAAGATWRALQGKAPDPFFKVETVTVDGAAVGAPYGVKLAPQKSIDDVERTDIIIVPSPGLDLDPQLVRN